MLEVNKIHRGNTLDLLKQIPDEFCGCIPTSPPYWGLRDYGKQTECVWDGDDSCEHRWGEKIPPKQSKSGKPGPNATVGARFAQDDARRGEGSNFCSKCNAWKGQLGLEPTLDLYIKHLLQITKELHRVLKKTGVMFWNHGDCYGGSGQGAQTGHGDYKRKNVIGTMKNAVTLSLTPKCLALQNYRLILNMIDEQEWILRNNIIWNKPNHMPSSVKDRFAVSYEPVFMLTKSKKYWFDLDAVRLPHKNNKDYDRHAPFNYRVREAKKGHDGIIGVKSSEKEMDRYDKKGIKFENTEVAYRMGIRKNKQYKGKEAPQNTIRSFDPKGKNPGDVWTINTQPFPEAHFATFPEKLVEPMIKAACPQWICKKCGKARVRIVKTKSNYKQREPSHVPNNSDKVDSTGWNPPEHHIIGWTDCNCKAGFEPGIVLDPFAGSGTACLVAKRLGRSYMGLDINGFV